MTIAAGHRIDIISCLTLAACLIGNPASAQVPLPVTEFLPVIAGTLEQRSTPFGAWVMDLSADDYVEREYLVSGLANIYDYVDAAARSSEVEVTAADRPYTTPDSAPSAAHEPGVQWHRLSGGAEPHVWLSTSI